ncbi:MAG: 5-formyltetrahydrofolate cyclo-ligase [Gammaproteobacteria bacterium]|nr:5-formyltetrahydrofolate cyclo-ligase [Gammaproteobacteria bacterium]
MKTGKTALRTDLRARRRALSPEERAARSRAAALAITRLHRFAAGATVAIYVPMHSELDTSLLIASARRRGVRLVLPVVANQRRRALRFYPLVGRMRPGAYGIPEPHRSGRPIGARWLDLVVVPLVGIDRHGHRLGMGGGYYDRAFAFRARRCAWHGPRLIGIAFDCQRVEAIPAERWDLRLDALATESGLTTFAEARR